MNERKMWLEAAESFRKDINAKVQCPSCKNGYLKVYDVPFDESEVTKGGERYLTCPNCNRTEIILYRKAPENWLKGNQAL